MSAAVATARRERPPGRRPALTDKFFWYPEGVEPGHPEFAFHVRVGFYADARPCEIFVTPSRSAAKHGSQLHARCEGMGMLMSWLLQRGATLGELDAAFKPDGLEGQDHAPGLELFVVRAAADLVEGRPSRRRGRAV